MRHLNYNHLLYFWTVAREGGLARASKVLHLTPQTISGQLKALEEAIGEPLFISDGRRLALSETGRFVYRYADAIFDLGHELSEQVRGRRAERPQRLRVGVKDSVAKLVACRVVQAALDLVEPVRLACRDGSLAALLDDLAAHRLDLVLADEPPSLAIEGAFGHLLGESGVSFFIARDPGGRYRRAFPASLNGAPMVLPDGNSVFRRELDAWLRARGIRPRVMAEIDDAALLETFGHAGVGVFPAPSVLEPSIRRMYGVRLIGRADGLRQRFYAISRERQRKHPAVLAVIESTRADLFSGPPGECPAAGLVALA